MPIVLVYIFRKLNLNSVNKHRINKEKKGITMARKKGSGKMIGMTQISISLPESLVQQIDELAKMDNRNRSNFIANTLQNLAREQLTVAEAKKKVK